jgi:CBS domain-containing protein
MTAQRNVTDPAALDPELPDEDYFEDPLSKQRVFDARLLREPVTVLPTRSAIYFPPSGSASDAMRAMQRQHRGCVLITEDGTPRSQLVGIFTERDVLIRIIDRGRNPVTLELSEIMTEDPEVLPADARIAWVLNVMSVGGIRHVPVVDEMGRPVAVVSVRDVVQFLVESFPGEVLNLPPEFGAVRYRTRDGA